MRITCVLGKYAFAHLQQPDGLILSPVSARAWCRQEGVNTTTYYRWERELLATAETGPRSDVPVVRFAELPMPKQVSCNVAERCATLHIGKASPDIYPGCGAEQLRLLVELLRLC